MAGKSNIKGSKIGNGRTSSVSKVAMTPVRASAIQSETMKTTGTVKVGTFAARVQSAAAHNVNAGIVPAIPPRQP